MLMLFLDYQEKIILTSSERLYLNDEITKVVVINKPVKESLDENGFTIIGITEFLLELI